ncbi:MAG: VWA domain-containing protein [Gemmataceae bacterium]
MAPLSRPVEPFGEVSARPQPDGSLQVVATVLMEPDIEGAACGLALDASASMKKLYGASAPVSPLFRPPAALPNVVEPVARKVAAYLARFAGDGTCQVLYGSCGTDGATVEDVGSVTEAGAKALALAGPRSQAWGRHTRLLPPLRALVNGVFPGAPWAIGVFVTDGSIDDLDDVERFSFELARDIAAGRRKPCKLVLLGLGEDVQEAHLVRLRDLFAGRELKTPEGEPIELWDYKLAAEMRRLEELFADVVSERATVADWGRIVGPDGRVAAEYRDGLPARLCFTLPAGSRSFTLEIPGGRVVQPLTSGPAV